MFFLSRKCSFFILIFVINTQLFSLTNVIHFSELDTVRQSYMHSINMLIQKNGYVFLTGFSGMGKSKIAKHFSNNNSNNYKLTWWIDCKKDISEQINTLIKTLNEQFETTFSKDENYEHVIYKANIFAKEKKIKMLLIFDSLDDHKKIKKILELCKSKKIHIIITSCKNADYASKIIVHEFTEGDALNLLKKIIPQFDGASLKQLSKSLKFYPLSLKQSASYLCQNKGISIDSYLDNLNNNRRHIWDKEEKFLSESEPIKRSIRSIMLLTMESCPKRLKEALSKTMVLFSILPNGGITSENIDQLTQAINIPKRTMEDILSFLIRNNVITPTEKDGKAGKRIYKILEIIQDVFDTDAYIKEKEFILPKILLFYKKFILENKNNLITLFKKDTQLTQNLEFVLIKAENHKSTNVLSLELKVFLLDYYIYVKRNHKEAVSTCEHLYHNRHDIANSDIIARFLSSSGDVLSLQKPNNIMTKSIIEKSIFFLEHNLTNDIFERVRLQNTIAQNLLLRTQSKKAKSYIIESLKLIESFKFPEQKIPTYYFATWTFCDLQDFTLADKYVDEAINLLSNVPDTAIKFYIYNFKAFINLRLKNYSKALTAADHAIAECNKYFEQNAKDTLAEALTYRADALLNLGKIKHALKTINEALCIYKNFYGGHKKVIDQVFSRIVKGDLYLINNQDKKALKQYHICLDILDKLNATKTSVIYKRSLVRIIFLLIKINKKPLAQTYIKEFSKQFPKENISALVFDPLNAKEFLSLFE